MTASIGRPPRAGGGRLVLAHHAPGVGQEEIRRRNLGAVLRYVHLHGPTPRTELTSRLGLNRSTIGALAADLTATGLVSEEPAPTTRRAGRPSLVVRPRTDRVYAYGLSIEADRLRAARIGLGGGILDRRETGRPHGMPAPDAVALLGELVRDMEQRVIGERMLIGGAVAVAHPNGEGDSARGSEGADIDRALNAAFADQRRFVSGDLADMAGLAELTRGLETDLADVIYLHGGSGISAGIISAGRLLHGHRGSNGQVGHMVVNPGGAACRCGSRGCWDTEVGEAALLRLAGRGPDPDEVRQVLQAAARGEKSTLAAVEHVADWLGFGTANLVNILSPAAVVFGGSLAEVYRLAADIVHRKLDDMTLPAWREHLTIRAATLGRDAALMGAAELAFEELLADPLSIEVSN